MSPSGGESMPALYSLADSRGVAQLVARGVWDAEVGGSSPLTPTVFVIPSSIAVAAS
jgi:hypothetical protein